MAMDGIYEMLLESKGDDIKTSNPKDICLCQSFGEFL